MQLQQRRGFHLSEIVNRELLLLLLLGGEGIVVFIATIDSNLPLSGDAVLSLPENEFTEKKEKRSTCLEGTNVIGRGRGYLGALK